MRARAAACVHTCELLCECACCTLILMAVECDCRRWSFVYCLVMDGFPVSDRPPFRRPSLWVSLCCTGPARKGGRAPFLSVSHWYSSLKWSVGHFCFIRSWNGREGGREGQRSEGSSCPLFLLLFYVVQWNPCSCLHEENTSQWKHTLFQQLQHLNLHQLPFLGSEIKHGLAHLKSHILHVQPEQDILSCLFIYLFILMSGFIPCLPLRLRLRIHCLPAKILSSNKRARSPYMLLVFVAFWDNSPKSNNTWSTGRTVFIICPTFFFFFFAKILTVPDSPSRRVNDILSSHILLQHSKYWYLEKKKHKRKKKPETSNSVLNILIDFFFSTSPFHAKTAVASREQYIQGAQNFLLVRLYF